MTSTYGVAPDANAQAGGSFVACGVRIDVAGFTGSVDAILRSRNTRGRAVHLCNAYTLSLARKDSSYAALLNRGDLNLPDGRPVAVLAKRLGLTSAVERVGGPDLMETVMNRGRAVGLRHYLYGSTQETIDLLLSKLRERYPGVAIVGSYAPPFRPLTDGERRDVVSRIRAASPDVVWVGLGTPKQDYFVDEFRDELQATLIAIGAAFDFSAGLKARAPRPLQRMGLEWAFRLATEPRRLWRRYLIGNVGFARGIVRDWSVDRSFSTTPRMGPSSGD